MRLFSWRKLVIIASVVWVAVGPTYFHLRQENDARRIAGDRYQLCIKQDWARKGGVERCNREFRQALTIAHWSSWAKLAFIPVALAWFVGWALFVLVRRVRSRPQAGSGIYSQSGSAEDNDSLANASAGKRSPASAIKEDLIAEQLQSVPACKLNISEEQYRAVGHVTLQWAYLEGEIDRELVWLNKRSDAPVNLKAKFEDRAAGWRNLAALVYSGHPELIDGVASISERAVAIKPERDKLVHCNLVSEGMVIRIRRGHVLDISDEGTAPHIDDLACRISNVTADLFRHQMRLARVFENPL
jgi:hypothetical protein